MWRRMNRIDIIIVRTLTGRADRCCCLLFKHWAFLGTYLPTTFNSFMIHSIRLHPPLLSTSPLVGQIVNRLILQIWQVIGWLLIYKLVHMNLSVWAQMGERKSLCVPRIPHETQSLQSVLFCTGANVLVDKATTFNISMTFYGVAPPPNTPPFGVRIDFWDATTNSYPPNSTIFFYQTGTKAMAFLYRLHFA